MAGRPRGITREQRFWEKVEKSDGCWIWTGASMRAYGKFWDGLRVIPAHRWAYEELVGEIPAGLTLDHLCRVQKCVRPDHLEPVTMGENLRRALPYRPPKTHCPYGHPYSGENLQRWSNGAARCRECERNRYRRRAASVSEQRKRDRRLRAEAHQLVLDRSGRIPTG
jgi:hypothetical protein